MDESIELRGGEKRIRINGDPNRVITFNPNDTLFMERFYALAGEAKAKFREYEQRAKELAASKELDEDGVRLNIGEQLRFLKEVCLYLRERIDHLFGEGTSQMVFGESLSLETITQFLQGVSSYVAPVRVAKVQPYLNTAVRPKRPRRKGK